jgi:hypothetical protein
MVGRGGMDGTAKGGVGAPPWNSRAARQARSDHAMAMRARKTRCLALPAPSAAELERMVADFLARGGGVTRCPTVSIVPVQNGDGPGGRPAADPPPPPAAGEGGDEPRHGGGGRIERVERLPGRDSGRR